jgi:uncharacterized protein
MTDCQGSYLSNKLLQKLCSDNKGYGIFARESIQKGELLVVWGGDIVTRDVLMQLSPAIKRYSIQVEENLYQIPTREKESTYYVNHSCNPNAGLSGQIALVALRDIVVDEEMCFDYAMCDGSQYDEFECHCGSPLCRRHVTEQDWRRLDLQKRYAGYFSPYLQRRIDRLKNGKNLQSGS